MNLEDLQAEVARLSGELEVTNANAAKLVKEKRDALTRAETAEAEREEAAERAEREAKDVEALERRITAKFQKDIDKLTGERDTANAQLRTVLVDNEIAKAIRDNNVRDGTDEALTALFTIKHKFENGVATIDGKSIGEYAAEYIASEKGAVYRRPADHSGADATGNIVKSSGGAKLTKRPTTPAEMDILDAMPDAERNAFCDSIGAADLKV